MASKGFATTLPGQGRAGGGHRGGWLLWPSLLALLGVGALGWPSVDQAEGQLLPERTATKAKPRQSTAV